MQEERWLLPVGIDEVLPAQARVMEALRRQLLDMYESWGYDYVIPPFVDFLESLLIGTGRDLNLQTFKLTDQLSGRTLGVRADMTPQIARMDAHHLASDAPARLCYMGSVLHTRNDGFAGTRSPMQIGAEVFGHSGIESDVEILRLLVATLDAAGVRDPYLDLGHVGIYRGLARQAGLDAQVERELFGALQRKAVPEIHDMVRSLALKPELADMLLQLAELNGDDALVRARTVLAAADAEVQEELDHLEQVAEELGRWLPDVPVHFDLAELRGYHYKTGVVFAAFVPGWGLEIARGGRYDGIGSHFGVPRPAVGFSTDLKGLMALSQGQSDQRPGAVFVPFSSDPALQRRVGELRASGRRVIAALRGQLCEPHELGATERLVEQGGEWVLRPLD